MNTAAFAFVLLGIASNATADNGGLCEDNAGNRQKVGEKARFELNKRLETSRLPDWKKLARERLEFGQHGVSYRVEFNSPSHTQASISFDCNGNFLAMSADASQGEAGQAALTR